MTLYDDREDIKLFWREASRFQRIAAVIIGTGFVVAFWAALGLCVATLMGCRMIGESQAQATTIQKEEIRKEQTNTATVATGAATVKDWAPQAATGRDAAVTIGSNAFVSGNIIYAPVFNAPAEQPKRELTQTAAVDAKALTKEDTKSSEAKEEKLEIKSSWYWMIIAVAFLIFVIVADYVRRVWFGGFSIKTGQFDLSKQGGLRVFGKMEQVISDHQGPATNPEVVEAFEELKREIKEYKMALQLKKRSDD